MRRLAVSGLVLTLAACSYGLGQQDEAIVSTVATRVDAGTSAAELAAALDRAGAEVALVAAPRDAAWFGEVAAATGLELSGPGDAGGLGLAFLAMEAVGDTTLTLEYEGGELVLQDALYDLGDSRYLDLLAFRVERGDLARPIIAALFEYIATDVMPASAVVLAVVVPDAAVGDSVGRMLSPGYFDTSRCAEGAAPTAGLRLFHGPEARIRCRSARVEGGVGDWIQATLAVGLR